MGQICGRFECGFEKKVSTIPTLTAEYGDKALLKILDTAMKSPSASTQRLAARLEAEQIAHWAANGKPPTEVLKIFGADEIASGLFTSSRFTNLVKYFDDCNTNHPLEAVSLISTSAAQYGDDVLFKILQQAKSIPSAETVASRLQAEQIQRLLIKNEHPRDVFTILGLQDPKPDEVLSNPLMKNWLKYLDNFNTKNPQAETSSYATIRSHFNADNVVNEAMKNSKTIGIAKRVQSDKFRWYLERKEDPASMFYNLIGRQRSIFRESNPIMNADNFLADPMFKAWARYLNDFNTKYPGEKTDMIKSLLVRYTDDKLSQALIMAKQNPSTEKMASNLQLSLLNKWAREKKLPTDVAKLLNMGSSDTLMKTYIKKYN